ncbi:uncharacterized protein LOC129610861 [Condylostylus longicornis]|uniref:uncharacterized protein LOC129610861 n=1 Tax=Condylostylus longicornis TaxID=2530218 RepID=UPI00244D9974|nr:uncharacterized protein LOC129610861 [Condylostylus longicornis]
MINPEKDVALKEKLKFLENNLNQFDKIQTYWIETFDYRQNLLKNFETLYGDKHDKLFFKWDCITDKLTTYFSQNKSKSIKLYTKTENSLHVFELLSILLAPSAYRKKSTENRRVKLTSYELLSSFLFLVKDTSLLLESHENLKSNLRSKSQRLQPSLFLVGDSYDDIQCSYVFVNDVLYILDSPLVAIDVCFKIIHAVNAEYQQDCEIIWMFLQKFVYEISTKYDKTYSRLNSLMSDLAT